MNDLIDEKGHTREQAKAQAPNLDLDAPPASEKTPVGSNTNVPAQSPAEVQAQINNPAGAPEDTHDLSEQLVKAGTYEEPSEDEADEAGDAGQNDEAAAIAEANEELDPSDEDADADADEDEDEA